ncbi:MAG: hypothetical protein R3C99_06630 [Pirellulaceae bacterium]
MTRRFATGCILFLLIAAPPILYGAYRAGLTQENRIEEWLPKRFDETKRLYWFAERFGSDELLMISYEGCTLDDPRLPELATFSHRSTAR